MHPPGLMSVLNKYETPLSIKHVYLLVKHYDNMSMRYYTCKMTIGLSHEKTNVLHM